MQRGEILKLYQEIFDEKGNIKRCGREKCKRLIKAMENTFPGVNFGSEKSGIMHPLNISKYIAELRKESL